MAFVTWITGLSGVGKTTVAKKVYAELKQQVASITLLDGDDFREIVGADVGHTREDRLINARRISNMCHYFVKHDISVICSTMSLFKEIHELNRSRIKNYLEVYLTAPIAELHNRDIKNIYKNYNDGKINNVVGLDLEFDEPRAADYILDNSTTDKLTENVKMIIDAVQNKFLENVIKEA